VLALRLKSVPRLRVSTRLVTDKVGTLPSSNSACTIRAP
jgi:hypothetical protein